MSSRLRRRCACLAADRHGRHHQCARFLQQGPHRQSHRLLFQVRQGSSGLGLGYGTVAVDPDVIPYGTLLYITSTDGRFVYGYAIATDTGIAVQKGEILVDLFYETYAESVINGAIQVNVYVVN